MAAPTYQTLDPDKIIETLEKLEKRISARFPGSGLGRVADNLTKTARATSATVQKIARPNFTLRVLVGLLIGFFVVVAVMLGKRALGLQASTELTNIVQGLDAGVSLLVVIGGAAYYLSTVESRLRNDKALKALHGIRTIVHVIDMHQLTKDPSAYGAPVTSASPERHMSPFELQRYLSYCSELLSLTSKVAALYADRLRDPVVVDAVGDIERLSSQLSLKMWQKIEFMEERTQDMPAAPAVYPAIPAATS